MLSHHDTLSSRQEQAALTLQRFYRKNRTLFAWQPRTAVGAGHVFVTNNHVLHGLQRYAPSNDQLVVLLSPSGFGGVDVICELSQKQSAAAPTPKLFILDRNAKVMTFWRHLMALFLQLEPEQKRLLYNRLLSFFVEQKALFYFSPEMPNEMRLLKLKSFANDIINVVTKYGYKKVRAIVMNTTVLYGKWERSDNFIAIKHFLKANHTDNSFVYASNAATFCNEYDSLQILTNIASLTPKLAMHTDYNAFAKTSKNYHYCEDNTPTKVLSELSKIIGNETQKSLRNVIDSYQATFESITLKLIELMLNKGWDIQITNIPFLISVIFKMSGIPDEVISGRFHNSLSFKTIVFHLDFSMSKLNKFVTAINNRFPALNANAPYVGENHWYAQLPMRISIGVDNLIALIPIIADYLENNPAVVDYYENVLGAGIKKIRGLFRKLELELADTNYFGKALCYMANEYYENQKNSPPVPFLMTANTHIKADIENFLQIHILVTTPPDRVRHLVAYLNSLMPNSAELHPIIFRLENKKTPHMQLVVKNTVLVLPEFLKQLEEKIKLMATELHDLEEKEIDLDTFKSEYQNVLTASTTTLFSSAPAALKKFNDIKRYTEQRPDSVAATVVARMRRK